MNIRVSVVCHPNQSFVVRPRHIIRFVHRLKHYYERQFRDVQWYGASDIGIGHDVEVVLARANVASANFNVPNSPRGTSKASLSSTPSGIMTGAAMTAGAVALAAGSVAGGAGQVSNRGGEKRISLSAVLQPGFWRRLARSSAAGVAF